MEKEKINQRAGRDARVRRLLAPRSIALVGVSEKSHWAKQSLENCQVLGNVSELYLVNQRGAETFGRSTYPSCEAVGAAIDLAVMLVPNNRVPDALRDAAAAGVGAAVLLGSGYGEAGAAGRAAQAELLALARELEIEILGPNCVGFMNLVERSSAWLVDTPEPLLPGTIAVVSQSGNLAASVADYLAMLGVGVSHVVSTGNELTLSIADVVSALIDDPAVRVCAVFSESIRDPETFLAAAARAAAAGKPIVVFKAGVSELAAQLAATHTGALAGNDALLDAIFHQYGVIRVGSLEQLAVTSALLAHTGPLGPGGLAMVSITGGGADIVADYAPGHQVALPQIGAEAKQSLAGRLADFSTLQNPFDITGAAMSDPNMMRDTLVAMGSDPSVALVACVYAVPKKPRFVPLVRGGLTSVAEGLNGAPVPGILMSNTLEPITADVKSVLDDVGIPFVTGGFEHGTAAIGHAMWWSAWLREHVPAPIGPFGVPATEVVQWSEHATLELLDSQGFSVVPHRLAATAQEAAAAATEFGGAVAVKLSSPQVLHKSDVGGVVLGVEGPAAVSEAFRRVTAAGSAVPGAEVDGALVAPVRRIGVEMILGVVRDPDWGLILAVGLGGVYAELVKDFALRRLPVTDYDAAQMLSALTGQAVLDGFRGAASVDREALVKTIVHFGELALAQGDRLVSMEINPLNVDGASVEALDAVSVWRTR